MLQDISNIKNNTNYSCIIYRSNEKQRSAHKFDSSQKKLKENTLLDASSAYNNSNGNNFGKRLEEIEADANALKRSMLESSHLTNSEFRNFIDHNSDNIVTKEYRHCKKQLQKMQTKYQQLIKENSTIQHDLQLKDMQIQRLVQENNEMKEENAKKDYKMK